MTNVAHLTQRSDTPAAVSFLQRLDPHGFHGLCAIHPDTRRVEGRIFGPAEWPAMADWIEARQGDRNLYYSVNEPFPDAPDTKLKKEHIARVRAVYADVDPKGEDGTPAGLAAERARIRALMGALLSDPLHSPTAVVDSGGGMQALWVLPEKLPAGEWSAWAEAQGRGIAHKVGGDPVQNIERVMRLPGTVNLPDAGKRKKGRRISVAELVEFNQETHPPKLLEGFAPPAAPSETTTDLNPAIKAAMAEIDMGAVHGAFSFDDLPGELRARFGAVLAGDSEAKRVWDGDAEALRGDDDSGSGFRAALARIMRPQGFTVTEFGQLLYVWDHATTGDRDAKLTARSIARDWVRMGRAAPEEDFEAVEVSDRPAPAGTVRPKLHFVSFAESMAMATKEQAPALIKGLLDCHAMSVMYGASNVGKTFVALDLAFHVASGRPWRGKAVNGGVVVYVAAEAGRGIHRRVAALGKHYGVADAALAVVPCPVDLLDARGDTEALVGLVRAAGEALGGPVVMIVIDTLSRALAGGDENSSVDMGAFVKHADRLRAAAGAHVMVVHHSGKDVSKGARGHSLLRAATDTEIEIADGQIQATKQREMEMGAPMLFRLHEVAVGVEPGGEPVTSCVALERSEMPAVDVALDPEEQLWHEAITEALIDEAERTGTIVEKITFDGPFVRDAMTGRRFHEGGKQREKISQKISLKECSKTTIWRRMAALVSRGLYTKIKRNQWVARSFQGSETS